jgi:hypothetical protein
LEQLIAAHYQIEVELISVDKIGASGDEEAQPSSDLRYVD